MTAACALAERASLALLIRQSISREDFATLYAPFARAVPVDVLGVLPQGVDDNAAASPLSPPLTSRDSVRRGA
jgi:hypothetical protein